jgi:hypothetical protein
MRCIASYLLHLAVLLPSLNLLAPSTWSSTSTQTRRHNSSSFAAWMSTTAYSEPIYVLSSSDNWLGGTGNWSNGADWSAGEPGSGCRSFDHQPDRYTDLIRRFGDRRRYRHERRNGEPEQ